MIKKSASIAGQFHKNERDTTWIYSKKSGILIIGDISRQKLDQVAKKNSQERRWKVMGKITKGTTSSPVDWYVTILRVEKKDERVCDYCNRPLVAPGGMVKDRCFLTQYGLVCRYCLLRGIPIICGYQPGEDVKDTAWYKGIGLYQNRDKFWSEAGIPRVCDYCGVLLVGPDGITKNETHLTAYEIICPYCIGVMPTICIYLPGEDVSQQPWWTGLYL